MGRPKIRTYVERTCEHCGKSYTTWEQIRPRYCSHKCHVAAGMVNTTCLCCGTPFVSKRYEHHKYCSAACAGIHTAPNRNKKIEKVCDGCGCTFMVSPSHHANRFCSPDCRNRKRTANTKRKCVQCGDSFTTKNSSPQKLCSRVCVAESKKRIEARICQQCGNSFTCWPSSQVRYCSIQCAWDSFKVEGSHSGYGPEWPHISDAIRKRDRYLCTHCNSPENGREHDVHHLVPLRTFGENLTMAHDPNNLVTLCRSCHSFVEAGSISLQLSLQIFS